MDSLPRLDGVRVLVVDDHSLVRKVLSAVLRESGATVVAVGTADAALEAMIRERPDVLVSDLEMPDRGGYWLIGQVRALPLERGGATPAAALTGRRGPEHRARVLGAGFQRHLEKPVDLDALLGAVASLSARGVGGLAPARGLV